MQQKCIKTIILKTFNKQDDFKGLSHTFEIDLFLRDVPCVAIILMKRLFFIRKVWLVMMNPNFDKEARALSIKYNECKTEFEKNSILSEMFVLCEPLIKYSIFKRKLQPPITYEDLEQECYIGILEVLKERSLETFEGKLTNVLLRAMQNRISSWINRTEHLIKIPQDVLYIMYDIKTFQCEFTRKNNRYVTDDDLLDAGFTKSEIERYHAAKKVVHYDSIDGTSDDENDDRKNDEMYLGNYVYDEYDYLNINKSLTDDVFDDERLNIGYKSLSKDQKDFLFELFNNDMNFELIAQQKNCNTWCVWQKYERITKKMKKAIYDYENPQPKVMSDKDKQLLEDLEKCGWNMAALAKKMGCSDGNIRRKISRIENRFGVKTEVKRCERIILPKDENLTDDEILLKELEDCNYNMTELARRLGCTSNGIQYRINRIEQKLGIKVKRFQEVRSSQKPLKQMSEKDRIFLNDLESHGYNMAAMAKDRGCSPSNIQDKAKRIEKTYGISIKEKKIALLKAKENLTPNDLSNDDRLFLQELKLCNWNMTKLAKQKGCSTAKVYNHITKLEKVYGIETPRQRIYDNISNTQLPPEKMTEKEKQLLQDLEKCNWNMAELARQYGLAPQSIQYRIARIEKIYGIKTGVKRIHKSTQDSSLIVS